MEPVQMSVWEEVQVLREEVKVEHEESRATRIIVHEQGKEIKRLRKETREPVLDLRTKIYEQQIQIRGQIKEISARKKIEEELRDTVFGQKEHIRGLRAGEEWCQYGKPVWGDQQRKDVKDQLNAVCLQKCGMMGFIADNETLHCVEDPCCNLGLAMAMIERFETK